jgi:hypothetical protein
MGSSSGTPLGADRLRGLNQPRPLEVAVDERGVPRVVRLAERDVQVVGISDVWRIDDGWWRAPDDRVSRMYFELTLETGAHITLYHDLVRESWHEQRA